MGQYEEQRLKILEWSLFLFLDAWSVLILSMLADIEAPNSSKH